MEKCLKEFQVGNALVVFSGSIVTEDDFGKRTYYPCGLLWDPWLCDTGKTVGRKNRVTITGDPGPKASIRICECSLKKDREVLGELPPTFENQAKGIRVWEYEKPLVIFIEGERDSEDWTISNWRMFSGRVIFDLAKNKFRNYSEQTQNSNNGNGMADEMNPETRDAIAAAQLDHGRAKNGGQPRHGRT